MELLARTLYHEIPLTKAMGIQPMSYDGQKLVLCAPLNCNINHKRTAFGGSLYSIAVLAGWGLLFLKLREAGLTANIVIQESSISYHLPVKGDFEASCRAPSAPELERLFKMLRRTGKGRTQLHLEIHSGSGLAVSFTGSFVVHS